MKTATVTQKPHLPATGRPGFQVLYTQSSGDHEYIELIGGRNPDGSLWTMSQEEAIQEIKAARLKLFVHKDGHEVDVIVSVSKLGNEYIKTKKDDIVPDNLLSLPDVP
ncbi:MAG: DUF3892 domain-containing protein [Thermoanaerobaculia bacterium]